MNLDKILFMAIGTFIGGATTSVVAFLINHFRREIKVLKKELNNENIITVTHLVGESTVLEDVMYAKFNREFFIVRTTESTHMFPLNTSSFFIGSGVKVIDHRRLYAFGSFLNSGLIWLPLFFAIQYLLKSV